MLRHRTIIMIRFIRKDYVVSFIFFVILVSGCSTSVAERQAGPDVDRPLVEPQISSDRPKILAFGDSLTAGFGLSEKESYPYLLQQKLDDQGYRYEVLNLGVSGETTYGGLERIDWVLEQENAEILILELGANDLLRGLPVAKMKSNLAEIIRKAKEKEIRVLLVGMLAPDSMGEEYQREFTMAFPDLARQYDVEFMPFMLEGVALNKELNQADGIHPNAKGTRIMTNNVFNYLEPMLSKTEE